MSHRRPILVCKDCDYEWMQHGEQEPIRCASRQCRSRNWKKGSKPGHPPSKPPTRLTLARPSAVPRENVKTMQFAGGGSESPAKAVAA